MKIKILAYSSRNIFYRVRIPQVLAIFLISIFHIGR